ncbi:MAG: CehA/McbA family metallohydrolase [Chloroflexi bacterium]|nr:CehA/McbA family metallohydrolase [Chloroflexota bacterium]
MTYYERVGCIHIHSRYSDGHAEPAEIVAHARQAGLDYIIITDHNAWQPRHEGWVENTLLLVGEELHDPAQPHSNHYLAFNAGADMVEYVGDPHALIRAVAARGGLGFIAHPDEHSGEVANEPEINWTAWDASGFTGLELWNYMSEFKGCVTSPIRALAGALWPRLAITGPYPETIARWDALQAERPVPVLAGVDAHAGVYSMGPFRRQVFGYAHLFRSLTTHLLLPADWSRVLASDAQMVYAALGSGRSFAAYDGLAPSRGFHFSATYGDHEYTLGDEFVATGPVRFRVRAPASARLRLLLNGHPVAEARGHELEHTGRAPGVYRVEAYRRYARRWRAWVFTNAIRVRVRSQSR